MSQQDDPVDRSQDPAIPPLPAQLTSSIGREREISKVKRLLVLKDLLLTAD